MLNLFKTKPDAVICSESSLVDNIHFVTTDGYEHFVNNSMINVCDGVITYVKSNIKYQVIHEKIQITNN